jgi:hypothetical protein
MPINPESVIISHTNLLHVTIRGGLISLWFYKENKLWDWKNVFTYSPLSSTHLWLRCSSFFNPSKKNSFGFAANRKSQRLISASTYLRRLIASEPQHNIHTTLYLLENPMTWTVTEIYRCFRATYSLYLQGRKSNPNKQTSSKSLKRPCRFLVRLQIYKLIWRRMVEWMYRSIFSWPRHWLEVSVQLHSPAALPLGKEPPVPIG